MTIEELQEIERIMESRDERIESIIRYLSYIAEHMDTMMHYIDEKDPEWINNHIPENIRIQRFNRRNNLDPDNRLDF